MWETEDKEKLKQHEEVEEKNQNENSNKSVAHPLQTLQEQLSEAKSGSGNLRRIVVNHVVVQ